VSADGHQMGGMGLGIGDYNLDGHTDLVKSHFIDQATGIYSNDGKGNFDDRTIQPVSTTKPLRQLRRRSGRLRQRRLPGHPHLHRFRLS